MTVSESSSYVHPISISFPHISVDNLSNIKDKSSIGNLISNKFLVGSKSFIVKYLSP